MKKFWIFIFLSLFVFSAQAAEPAVVIENLQETPIAAEIEHPDFNQRLNRILTELQHFDTQYPGNAIYTDFSADVASRFPELSTQEVMDYENYIRKSLAIYRWGKNLYQSYKEKLLAPETPPLILDDSEYDLLSPAPEYIAADSPIIIEDFKKVISYSSDPKDTKSYIAKLAYDAKHGGAHSDWSEFVNLANAIDWRHIFSYDIYYHSPLTGNKGIGDWNGDANSLRARILTIETGTGGANKIRGAIHLLTAPQHFVIATGNQKGKAPQISFAGSDNLRNISYNLPMPERFLFPDDPWQDLAIYSGEIAIPFTAEISDSAKPAQIAAELNLWLCDKTQQCLPLRLMPQLRLESENTRESSVAAYIRQLHNQQIRSASEQISVTAAGVENLAEQGEILKIELKSREKISFFDIFINSPNEILLQRPRVTIDGKNITARVLPVDAGQSLKDKDFEIIANLNGRYLMRQQYHFAAMDNAPAGNRLSWHLIWLALLGGFILNFMPCVFPVLSLKLFSLTRFGARRSAVVRRNFAYTLFGLFGAFAVLAAILALLKVLSLGIGWGMQFQSPIFLVLMVLAIVLFILQIGGLVEIRLPDKWQSQAAAEHNNLLNFLTGTLVVLMATPCTAPYLSTVIGFALAGSVSDIFAVMAAVAAGLALPYILLYAFPSLIVFVPTPGPWMKKLNRFMLIMLWLTLLWLFSVVWAQTGWGFALRLIPYALLFAACCALIRLNRETADSAANARAVRAVEHLLLAAALLISVIAAGDAHYAGKRHLQELRHQTVPAIEQTEIANLLRQGKTVLVTVGADWCLTCRYNNAMVFKNPSFLRNIADKGVAIINVDWTNYDNSTLQFMEKYGRSGLPFYIIFSPLLPEGMVLPELLNEQDLNRLINNITLYQPPA